MTFMTKKVQSDLRNETRDEFYIIWVLHIAYIYLVLRGPNGPRYLGNPRQHKALEKEIFAPSTKMLFNKRNGHLVIDDELVASHANDVVYKTLQFHKEGK